MNEIMNLFDGMERRITDLTGIAKLHTTSISLLAGCTAVIAICLGVHVRDTDESFKTVYDMIKTDWDSDNFKSKLLVEHMENQHALTLNFDERISKLERQLAEGQALKEKIENGQQ